MNHDKVYVWTGLVLQALRQSLTELEFIEITPAILSKRFEPGARHSIGILGAKQLPVITENSDAEIDNEKIMIKGNSFYYLPVSHVVEKQMALEYLSKVYCLAPCVRLVMDGEEISGKHLYTFFQVEIEWHTQDMQEVFYLAEKIIIKAAQSLLDKSDNTQTNLSYKNLKSLTLIPYPKITFTDALLMVDADPNRTQDLSSEEDLLLSKQFDRPFWIYNYPPGVRDSIYQKNTEGKYDTYDLMLPFGYGELATGGVRPESGQEIIRQSQMLGKAIHAEYAEWKDRSKVQSAGFGIGLERFIRFCAEVESILDIIPYHDAGPNTSI
ncbi:hypothetical protein H0W32_02490 [Patescibacteria group bacterium]|nr:hypothetical protein [Patescibacteria group bacterium]